MTPALLKYIWENRTRIKYSLVLHYKGGKQESPRIHKGEGEGEGEGKIGEN